MGLFVKFNCPYFATVPLDHVSSLDMFIVFFLIEVPALGTIILTGNFETVASPRLPDSPRSEPNKYLSRNFSVPITCQVHCGPYAQGIKVLLEETYKQL